MGRMRELTRAHPHTATRGKGIDQQTGKRVEPKATRGKPAPSTNDAAAWIATQPEARRARLQRHQAHMLSHGGTLASVPADALNKTVIAIGAKDAAALLGVNANDVREKIGKPPRGAGVARPHRARSRFDVELTRARTAATDRGEMIERHGLIGGLAIMAATELVDDADDIVRLDSLKEGARVKTPNSVAENIPGVEATLVRLGTGSASVRLGATRRVAIDKDDGTQTEFNAPGRLVQWALSTMVVPLPL